ncbi:hypothetical protein LFM09_34265 [Lentzea alba]|uniref:hypothetical protein n=1 Tax=Lentzea alba TaxID=2714351 RepID=UPI0039BF4011
MTNALRPIIENTAASRRGWLRFADLLATLVGSSLVIAGLPAWFLVSTAVFAARPRGISVLVTLISISVLVGLTVVHGRKRRLSSR